jgi:6-phosphogluconolactonase
MSCPALSSFAILTLIVMSNALPTASADVIDVWIGTGNQPPSKGIYHCTLNRETGALSKARLAAEIQGPGFLAMHPSGSHLYAVGTLDGVASVVAYAIEKNAEAPSLQLVNALAIGDGGACHVAVEPNGGTLLTAQYGGGSVAAFSLNQDGSLKARTALINHDGSSGVVAGVRNKSHAHWVGFSPDNRFAFVPDLGLDKVVIYKHNTDQATIEPSGTASVPAGSGPRHMKFHPNGKWAFVLNELALTVTVFDYDSKSGEMTPKQTIPAVPKAQLAKELTFSASEIRVHPSGKFVYSANRGHDTITAYRVNQESGELSVIEIENARAAEPRNFNLDPSGKWMLVAGQHSHTLGVFRIDQDSGELTYNRKIIHSPSAICVLFQHE